jgi:hypothetical protein
MNDIKAERAAKREAAIEAAKVTAGISAALSSPEGRALLWWVLEISGTFQQSFSSNALLSSFNAGKREVGLLTLARITQTDPLAFIRMQAERAQAHDTRASTGPDNDGTGSGDNNGYDPSLYGDDE